MASSLLIFHILKFDARALGKTEPGGRTYTGEGTKEVEAASYILLYSCCGRIGKTI